MVCLLSIITIWKLENKPKGLHSLKSLQQAYRYGIIGSSCA